MSLEQLFVLDVVRTNHWNRPVCFALSTGSLAGWLEPYARIDGLHWRIVPVETPRPDLPLLRGNLEQGQYRGFADPSIVLDPVTQTFGALYQAAHDALLAAEQAQGNADRCRSEKAAITASLPPERLPLAPDIADSLRARCDGGRNGAQGGKR